MLAALMLIEIRLMLDVLALQGEVQKGSKAMSNEDHRAFCKEVAMSDMLLSRPDVVNQDDHQETVAEMAQQVYETYELVKKNNEHF